MITALTTTTPVPTHARGALRAFIRGQAGFKAWREVNGIPSHNVQNPDLIRYAQEHGLDNEVLAIINQTTLIGSMTAAHDNFGTFTAADLEIEPVTDNAARDREMEALIAPAAEQAAKVDLQEVLKPIEPFLSPLVRSELEKALQPLVTAANRPPVHIIERVPALPVLPAGALPYAHADKVSTLGALFGVRGQHSKVPVTTWEAHGAAMRPDPYYVTDAQLMFEINSAVNKRVNVFFTGMSGTGKSTAPVQYAAVTGRPCVRIPFTRQTDVGELVGGPAVLVDGSTQWQDGALIQAMKRPGTFIVFEEPSIAPPGVQTIIQHVTDGHRSYTLPTGEVVTAAPDVMFFMADNTNGTGDSTGQYHGTNPINQALVNRFGFMIEVDYMDKKAEAKALRNHTGAPLAACDLMADFAARARKLPAMESMVLSLRQMTAFIKAVQEGWTVKRAAVSCFLSRLPAPERAVLETLFTLTWSDEFGRAMGNEPAPAIGTGNADNGAFDDEVTAELNRS